MITLDEAMQAWQTKQPVQYRHPMDEKTMVCTVGAIQYSKRLRRLLKITLCQHPGNSFIVTRPEYVTPMKENKTYSEELRQALDELERIRE